MDNLDSKRDLDKYIYNYMKKRNFHSTAEIFFAEANISPNDVGIDSDEGFLTDWWSIFWSVFNTKHTDHEEVRPQSTPTSDLNRTMFDSSITMSAVSGNVSFPRRSDFPRMMPTPSFRFPTPSFNSLPNQLGRDQTVQSLSNCYPSERVYKNSQFCLNKDGNSGSSCWKSTNTITGPTRYLPKPTGLIIKSPDSRRLEQEQLMLPFRNSNVSSNHTDCGVRYLPRAGPIEIWSSNEVPQSSVPVLGLSPDPTTLIPVADVRRVREQEHIRVPAKNDYFNPDQVIQLLSSSPTDCGHAQKNKKRHICDIGADEKCCAIRKSSIVAVEPQIEPPSFSAASVSEQVHHGVPQMDLDSNTQLLNVGQLSRLLSAPTKFNYTQQNAHKEGQCCVTRDEGLAGTTSRRYVAAEPTRQSPKAIIQPKMEPAEADDD